MFGSQGEQRLAVLSLLLGEADLLGDRGPAPLLLLDDVLSELDPRRREILAARVSSGRARRSSPRPAAPRSRASPTCARGRAVPDGGVDREAAVMDRLGDEIQSELGRFGPQAGTSAAIVEAWPEAVGATIARNAWPARIGARRHAARRDARLDLGLRARPAGAAGSGSGWGSSRRRAIRFAPGRIPEPDTPPAPEPAAKPLVEPDPETRKTAATLASEIEDETLRGLVERAVAASLARAADDRPL